MKQIICGIDFGTSNSAVALADPERGSVTLAPVEDAHLTIPSTIFIGPTNNAHFGREAIHSYVARSPGRFMRSLKRILGTSLMKEGTSFGHKRLDFHDVLVCFVSNLRDKASAAAGSEVKHVVAGRPVHFVDGDSKADAEAEQQLRAVYTAAGFTGIQFQYEPIAAAFAHETRLDDREYLAFVIDIGGGTSDFAAVKLSGSSVTKQDRRKDILASAGIRIGGNDFDRILSLASVMPLLGKGSTHGAKSLPFPSGPFHDLSEWSRIQHMYTRGYRQKLEALMVEAHEPHLTRRLLTVVDAELGHALMAGVEETKIQLSSHEAATADLGFIENNLAAPVDRCFLEDKLAHKLANLNQAIEECLKKARIPATAIDLVVLTGGATSMPCLQAMAQSTFPNARVSDADRLSSVASGLAYSALKRYSGAHSGPRSIARTTRAS